MAKNKKSKIKKFGEMLTKGFGAFQKGYSTIQKSAQEIYKYAPDMDAIFETDQQFPFTTSFEIFKQKSKKPRSKPVKKR